MTAIFSNPKAQGYRLITRSGATVPFGSAPGGNQSTGAPLRCSSAPVPVPLDPPKPSTISLAEFNRVTTGMTYPEVVAVVGAQSEPPLGLDMFGHHVDYRFWSGEVPHAKATIVFRDGVEVEKGQLGLR